VSPKIRPRSWKKIFRQFGEKVLRVLYDLKWNRPIPSLDLVKLFCLKKNFFCTIFLLLLLYSFIIYLLILVEFMAR